MILGLIIYIATLVIDIVTDYNVWLHKRTVNHYRGALLRLIGLVPAMWLLRWWGLGLLFSYWMLMDSIFGTLIARTPLYVGTTSYLDRLQRRNPWVIVSKFAFGLAGLVLFITYGK